MPDKVALIRPFKVADDKLVRFVIGKANFERLAVANHRTCTNPITIAIWAILSYISIRAMNWWPDGSYGPAGYLKPLPAVACTALPLMFLVDWINRPDFEKHTQGVLRGSDLHNIADHYSQPGRGLWILEYGEQFVGLIALDRTKSSPKNKDSQSTAQTATIRHLYVDGAYRRVNPELDLLQYAIKFAFESTDVKQIQISVSPLLPSSIRRSLAEVGFKHQCYEETPMGLLRWRSECWALQKSNPKDT